MDVTLAVCPGLASTSEQLYIKAFVSQAIQHGYRVVVLNHLGMLEDVKLTTPRVFNLGMSYCGLIMINASENVSSILLHT